MTSKLRATALVSWSILMLGLSGQGCKQCVDKLTAVGSASGEDVEYCPLEPTEPYVAPPRLVAPPLPDMNVYQPADIGPADPDAVARAVIFAESCALILELHPYEESINHAIYDKYHRRRNDAGIAAMFERTACFKDKTTGCDAVRECWGMFNRVVDVTENLDALSNVKECDGGVLRNVVLVGTPGSPQVEAYQRVYNCKSRGLECYNDQWWGPYCAASRTPCDLSANNPPCTTDDRPFWCKKVQDKGWADKEPVCADFGLTCDPYAKDEMVDCIGTGPACDLPPYSYLDAFTYDYAKGAIGCESETTLRTCMGDREQLIDCGTLGKGFKCISGPAPYCGLDSECNVDDPVTCEGNMLVFCNVGKIQKVDCTSLGFEVCDPMAEACGPNTFNQLQPLQLEVVVEP
ncbi:MAG TPA: hypothetical protein PK156_01240 [Polyangium sp.]|nr:hypothetical protein [Polyangium sp.]